MKTNFVDLGVTDNVIGQVKVKMFDDWSCMVLSCPTTVSNGKSQYSKMDRVWDTYNCHPKLLVSTLKVKVVQGR